MIAASSRMRLAARHATRPEEFVAAAFDAFERAAAGSGQHERCIQVAGRVIRLRFAGDALIPAVMPALTHLEVDHRPSSGPALDVALFETESTGVRMPPPAWGPFDWGPKGEITGFNDERIRTVYQPGADILHLFDADRSAAVYWTRTRRTIPWWETSFPLRTILHWWAAPLSLQPTHAGAVARGGIGVLVGGESGAGKSTTTLACLEGGLGYLGDDYVMVDVDEPSVHSLYSTAKLEPENLERFPLLAPLVANLDDLDAQKAMLMLHDHRRDQLRVDAALRAIVLPRITDARGTELTLVPPSAAMASLAPTTLFHLPGFGRQVVGKFSRLVRSVPCYRIDVGYDMDEIASTVSDLLEELR